ncbi:tol-pal system-associated acyl-CoA thioesterase [Ignatzschineria rhizosphaerae]|uniref:Tol-pal system-associated acyl-CoA thioesterase n=1 Tax=Ignatzschineria rhizosphaerae TaxID=2923279 RepID=A0ABY3X309_9GAMM|nr:tol-pal system-associated acyl-CoA thioesterase [Ignatzschineria rhizosphaerae]UNM96094.1 tol-pal system-associated acyl-CoA thioesterase [Ignatzschineria rhizosphaerae]
MVPKAEIFELPIRVYYEDTDAGGIVYHSTYLNFMERARTEWLLAKGINLNTHAQTHLEMFVVRKLDIEYRQPAHLCDDLVIQSRIIERSRTRAIFEQNILRGDEVLTRGNVEIVTLDVNTRRPKPLPNFF